MIFRPEAAPAPRQLNVASRLSGGGWRMGSGASPTKAGGRIFMFFKPLNIHAPSCNPSIRRKAVWKGFLHYRTRIRYPVS